MSGSTPLVGRTEERDRLAAALDAARAGEGTIVLISGEAGVGKSRLAAHVSEASDALVLTGAGETSGSPPYGPLVAALRAYRRPRPQGLRDCGPLTDQLALLLPELGPPPAGTDRSSLFEAVRCALANIAADG